MITAILLLLQAAAPAPTATPTPAAAVPGSWTVRERTDPATGFSSVLAPATARDGSSRLIVKCDKTKESVVSVQFIARQALATADDKGNFAEKSVSMRFDGGPAIEYNWEFQGNAAYIRDSASVTALTIELAKAKVIQVSTTNAANFGFEGTFDGPASDAPISQVLTACGYTPGEVPVPKPATKR